jgi:two-component system CheB/CheR fusion protein
VRNLFALASSLVTLSARSAATPQAMAEAARERLGALARAHDLTLPDLARGPEAIETATTLPVLLEAIVAPYDTSESDNGRRVRGGGPAVRVRGGAVTSLALLLNEFAANSAKYGALSSPAGHVEVDWSVANDELRLTWQEQGGPPLERPPDSEGFGTRLVRATVQGQLGGELARDWRPEGLVVRLSLPLASLTA